MVAIEDGVYGFGSVSEHLSLILALESELRNNQANDGKVNAARRLLIGTMSLYDTY